MPLLPSFDACVVTNAPDQRTFGSLQVPFVLSPPHDTPLLSPDEASAFVKENRGRIDDALEDYGAVLFRGFPLETPEDFNTFVQAFDGYNDLSYDKSMSFAVRTRLADRICTTNEGKLGRKLEFHHEQAQTPLWPSHVFFCCLLPAQPGDGGATGIVNSELVYEKLLEEHPKLCQKCEKHGVRYTVYAGPEQDTTKGAGRSWKSFFHAETKEEAMLKMKAGGWTWTWGVGARGAKLDDDYLKCTTPVLEAVKVAPGFKREHKTFFNQLVATTANALEFRKVGKTADEIDSLKDEPTQEDIDECVRFGNGDPIPLDFLLDAKRICEENAVDILWQQGDVALISNYLMMHSRRPWSGPEGTRKLLASLVQEEDCTSFGKSLVVL